MAEKTISAPLAIIEMNGRVVGRMRNIRIQEQVQRGDVRGLGELLSQEKPIMAVNCSFSCSFAVINISKLGTIENPFVNRGAQNPQQFIDTILLTDIGVNIHLYRKIAKTITSNVVTETSRDKIGVIYNAFMDSQNIELTEGNIMMSDISGTYLVPVLFNQ